MALTRQEAKFRKIYSSPKGPLIGSMIMVALAVTPEQEQKLQWLGVKDSKLLSREAREEMFDRIHEIVHDFRIEVIEADAVDNALNDINSNLNWLEANSQARMCSELNPDLMIIDCPSINIQGYTDYFKTKLSKGVLEKSEIRMEHKADAKYPVVAAASVVAKVIRDRSIDHLKEEIGIDFGSGYMGDQKTRDFLSEHYDNPKCQHIFRKMWKPYQNLVEAKKQKKLGEF